jgi:signal transduction histidine kinase
MQQNYDSASARRAKTVATQQRTEERITHESHLYRLWSAITDLETLLRAILEESLEAVGATRGTISLVDYRTGELVTKFVAGLGWSEEKQGLRFKITDEPGNSISSYVAHTGLPYICPDVTNDPHYYPIFPDTRSELAVPLIGRGGRVLGVLNVESERANAFGENEARVLSSLASIAAFALSLAAHQTREKALIELGKELAATPDIDTLLERVTEMAAKLLDADDCSLFLLDKSINRLVLKASRGLLRSLVDKATYRLGEGLTGWVALHNKPARLNGVVGDPRWKGLHLELKPEEISAFMAVPVRGRREVVGVLRVLRKRANPSAPYYLFTDEDEELLFTLASQLGAALEREELQRRLFTMQHIATIGELAARTAHMIGNKVFAMKGALKELSLQLSNLPLPENAQRLLTSVERALYEVETLLQDLRDFVKATQLNLQPVCLSEMVEELVREYSQEFPHISFELQLDEQPIWVKGDTEKLKNAVSELIENSVHFLKEGDKIAVRLTKSTWVGQKHARLIIRDTGPGVPDKLKEQIFQPFFTTRAKGMGLGLAIVKGIIEAHGGTIEERGREGEGAMFIITLPAIEPAQGGES